jgi:membrane-bound lytic murein transglycosylase B
MPSIAPPAIPALLVVVSALAAATPVRAADPPRELRCLVVATLATGEQRALVVPVVDGRPVVDEAAAGLPAAVVDVGQCAPSGEGVPAGAEAPEEVRPPAREAPAADRKLAPRRSRASRPRREEGRERRRTAHRPGVVEAPALPPGGFPFPPFLLPVYQAAAAREGVPWEVLAAINDVETAYGRNVAVSSAGALGWMQFMPASWRTFGVDANHDGRRDPDNPVDAVFAAARYLAAAGAARDLEAAIFAYNHADWYVRAVLARVEVLRRLPPGLVDGLTAMAAGAQPVRAPRARAGSGGITARAGTPVVAPADGVVRRRGRSGALGRFVEIEDRAGHRYRFAHLGTLARLNPVRRRRAARPAADRPPPRERLFAHPWRPRAWAAGGRRQVRDPGLRAWISRVSPLWGTARERVALRPMRVGSRVRVGTIVGRLGRASRRWAERTHVRLDVRPAGRAAPWLDGAPLAAAWLRLEREGWGARAAPPAAGASAGLADPALRARVLDDPRITLYACGRADVRAGRVDRRVLIALLGLADAGMHPTVTSLRCGHSYLTSSGNVSHHSSGNAVDIAAINGVPVLGNQGRGTVAEAAARHLLALPGEMRPAQVVSLMPFAAPNALVLADHDDHLHVGWHPDAARPAASGAAPRLASGADWQEAWASLRP